MFSASPNRPAPAPRGRHVVFVNWRDSRHPQAGGAELYCESVARRMAAGGATVTLLTSRPRGTPRKDLVEGVCVRRYGGAFSVYAMALLWLLRHRRTIDWVVDCQNGIPFFSPLALARTVPVLCLIFHVHQEQFEAYFKWPVSRIGQWLEGPGCRMVYRSRPIVVISPSTRADVRQKLKLKGNIFVVPCGMDHPLSSSTDARALTPRIACVGRLVPHKQMHLLLEALPAVLASQPDLIVDIAGTGAELPALELLADALGVSESIRFHGRVSDRSRQRLLAEAWVTVNPSVGEGWGLSVIEANSCGTPAVAFRVPGLRDAVVDGETGWLVEPGELLAPAITKALAAVADPLDGEAWSARAISWARRFDWAATTLRIQALLEEEEDRLRRPPVGRDYARRATIDLACLVVLPATAVSLSALADTVRRVDVWTLEDGNIIGLLHGADEAGVRRALERLGIGDHAIVRPARPSDWLLSGEPIHVAGDRFASD
jgi:glycosyltransferase involved in cell wall biosynthesis